MTTASSPSPSREDALARIRAIVDAAVPFPPLAIEMEPEEKPKRKRKPALVGGLDGEVKQEKGGQGGDPPDDIPPHEGADSAGHGIPPAAIEQCALEELNDVGNGQRLLLHFGDAILHVRDIGWHAWMGTHWSKEGGDDQVTRCAQVTAARIKLERSYLTHTKPEQEAIEAAEKARRELAELDKIVMHSEEQKSRAEELRGMLVRARLAKAELGKRKGARAKFSISCGNTSKINGMITQALPHKTVAIADLDKDPLAFNVVNGTLRFVQVPDDECPDEKVVRLKWAVRFDAHNRTDLISKCAPVEYNPDAKCPQWDEFLERVQPDLKMRCLLRDFHGYGLTGRNSLQAFLYLVGTGANGKSTFIVAITRALGDYADTLNPESLMTAGPKQGGAANPDIADLPGVRLLAISELPERAKLQESLIKRLTGGEVMKARHNYDKGFFKFYPVFKASMSGNDKPELHDLSEGLWRRVLIVPWDVMIPKEERKEFEAMQDVFEGERSGILNWLIEGALTFLNAGGKLDVPPQVLDATAEHREDMDPIGQFLTGCCERVEGCKMSAGLLYRYYEAWCHASGLRPLHQTTFGKTVPKHGWVKVKLGTVYYLDMRMHEDAPKPDAHPRDPHSGFIP